MKKALLTMVLLAAMGVTSNALAAGINLGWDDCYTASQTALKTFNCATNSGSAKMYGSFILAAPQVTTSGISGVVDLQANDATLPDWWQFYNAGTCRINSLSCTFDFSSVTGCMDPFQQPGQGGLAAYQTTTSSPPNPYPDPARARIKFAGALALGPATEAGVEYYGVIMTVNYAKTVGTGSCTGCTVPVTIVLNELDVADNLGGTGAAYEYLTDPIANRCVFWQSSSGVPCATLPTRNTTWGQVKSLYR